MRSGRYHDGFRSTADWLGEFLNGRDDREVHALLDGNWIVDAYTGK
jgi:hypothetical protein